LLDQYVLFNLVSQSYEPYNARNKACKPEIYLTGWYGSSRTHLWAKLLAHHCICSNSIVTHCWTWNYAIFMPFYYAAPIFDLILALIWFMFLNNFMSNLDQNGSNLLPLTHIVLITYFVLLSGENPVGFDRKEYFWTSFKKDRKSNKAQRTDGNKAEHRIVVHHAALLCCSGRGNPRLGTRPCVWPCVGAQPCAFTSPCGFAFFAYLMQFLFSI